MKLSMFEPRNTAIPLFFNVETSVGRRGHNTNTEDILLVQFLIKKNCDITPVSEEAKAAHPIMKKVPLSGKVDQATIDGIEAFQKIMRGKFPGTVVDGRVSVARQYGYGSGLFTITGLNGFVRRHFQTVWPRLQDFSDCPKTVADRAKEIL